MGGLGDIRLPYCAQGPILSHRKELDMESNSIHIYSLDGIDICYSVSLFHFNSKRLRLKLAHKTKSNRSSSYTGHPDWINWDPKKTV